MYIKALLYHLIPPFLPIVDKSAQRHIAIPVLFMLHNQIPSTVALVVFALLHILFLANVHVQQNQTKIPLNYPAP